MQSCVEIELLFAIRGGDRGKIAQTRLIEPDHLLQRAPILPSAISTSCMYLQSLKIGRIKGSGSPRLVLYNEVRQPIERRMAQKSYIPRSYLFTM